jgi:hypothetical protein
LMRHLGTERIDVGAVAERRVRTALSALNPPRRGRRAGS